MTCAKNSSLCLFLTFDWAFSTTPIPDSIESFKSSELCLNALQNCKWRQELTHGIIHYLLVRSFVTFGKLRTTWLTSEKNGTSSVIRLLFGNSSPVKEVKPFGNINPPGSMKRASSVIFDNLRKNRTLLNIFGNPSHSDKKNISGNFR